MLYEYEYHGDVWAGPGACHRRGCAFGGGYTSGGELRGPASPEASRQEHGVSPSHAGVGQGASRMYDSYLTTIWGVAMISLGVVRRGVRLWCGRII